MHRQQPAGAAAPRGPGRTAVGALPRWPKAGLGPGGDGRVPGDGRGRLLVCGDPLLQPRDALRGDQSYCPYCFTAEFNLIRFSCPITQLTANLHLNESDTICECNSLNGLSK